MKKIKGNLQNRRKIVSEEERQSIERGLEDSKNGRVTPHSEVRKRYEKWL